MITNIELGSEPTTSLPPTTIAEDCYAVDEINAGLEADNQSYQAKCERHKTTKASYDLFRYTPPNLRTWEYVNDSGELIKVLYPEILLVHGVASNHTYFKKIIDDMCRLGIKVSALDLPRTRTRALDKSGLMEMYIEVIEDAYKSLAANGSQITIAGHSFGGQLAARTAAKLVQESNNDNLAGIIALSPAWGEAMVSLPQAAFRLGGLAVNTAQNHDKVHSLRLSLMILRSILLHLPQTASDTQMALGGNVEHLFDGPLQEIAVGIFTGEKDEFVDHTKILRMVSMSGHENVTLITHGVNHMLDIPNEPGIYCRADIRTLAGEILAFLQSQMPNYVPLVFNANSSPRRLSRS